MILIHLVVMIGEPSGKVDICKVSWGSHNSDFTNPEEVHT